MNTFCNENKYSVYYIVKSEERFFHRFTSNFRNRNSFWQKLNMELTFQKMPGYKNGSPWKMLL